MHNIYVGMCTGTEHSHTSHILLRRVHQFFFSGVVSSWCGINITTNILAEFYHCGFYMKYRPWAYVFECLVPRKCAAGEVLESKGWSLTGGSGSMGDDIKVLYWVPLLANSLIPNCRWIITYHLGHDSMPSPTKKEGAPWHIPNHNPFLS